MLTLTETKSCQACGKQVKGRSDKKFCDDYCRNSFNNQLNSNSNNYVRNINNILRRNRRILEDLLSEEDNLCKIKKGKLLRRGFDFEYHTHTYTNRSGKTYQFCYEYGYVPLEKELYHIVKRKMDH